MDDKLKEALEAIKLLRAELWIAYDGNGVQGKATHPVEATRALDAGEKVLRDNGESDDMMEAEGK